MKTLRIIGITMLFMLSCGTPKNEDAAPAPELAKIAKDPAEFVPDGYSIVKGIKGDLNNDGLEDVVLVIHIPWRLEDESDEDDNRGIIIAFNRNGHYEEVMSNKELLFWKLHQDGEHGPENGMNVSIEDGNLIIGNSVGWSVDFCWETYKFRHQNSDFELIGYDWQHNEYLDDYVRIESRDVNFLAKTMETIKRKRENVSEDAAELRGATEKSATEEDTAIEETDNETASVEETPESVTLDSIVVNNLIKLRDIRRLNEVNILEAIVKQ